jgi:hypothetical protein
MSIAVSSWYTSFGNYTFPSSFIRLNEAEIKALLNGETGSKVSRAVIDKLDYVIDHLPGSCFLHADCCAPTDSTKFQSTDFAVKKGQAAWEVLLESSKVISAFKAGDTERLVLHSYRRVDKYREFRAFIKGRKLLTMSQRYINKHVSKLNGRENEIWQLAEQLFENCATFLPLEDIVVDLYLTSTKRLMILDMNLWGECDPLLLKDWDQDWNALSGLKLVPKPLKLSGDVSVSF